MMCLLAQANAEHIEVWHQFSKVESCFISAPKHTHTSAPPPPPPPTISSHIDLAFLLTFLESRVSRIEMREATHCAPTQTENSYINYVHIAHVNTTRIKLLKCLIDMRTDRWVYN